MRTPVAHAGPWVFVSSERLKSHAEWEWEEKMTAYQGFDSVNSQSPVLGQPQHLPSAEWLQRTSCLRAAVPVCLPLHTGPHLIWLCVFFSLFLASL